MPPSPSSSTAVAGDPNPTAYKYDLVPSIKIVDGLSVSFHEAHRVQDHEKWVIQKVKQIDGRKEQVIELAAPRPEASEPEVFHLPVQPIQMKSSNAYKLKITVGGQNIAMPGPTAPDEPGTCKQDYYLPLKQEWIDGVTVREGLVRQFIALPPGTGYSVEHQITGQDVVQDFQIEVFQRSGFYIIVDIENDFVVTSRLELCGISEDCTIHQVKLRILESLGRTYSSNLYFSGEQLEDDRTLHDYGIQSGHTIADFLWTGVKYKRRIQYRMEIAPGGLIAQSIYKDPYPDRWMEQPLTTFKVRVVDVDEFRSTTKLEPKPFRVLKPLHEVRSWREIFNLKANTNDPVKGLAEISKEKPSDVVYGQFQALPQSEKPEHTAESSAPAESSSSSLSVAGSTKKNKPAKRDASTQSTITSSVKRVMRRLK
ncbi:hypothetical protein PT974_04853 [Cladobotryum mycophilum]|uniref:Ubiquitin-like domain-containing protein n=1 Tax=Cladobotryum mycophilum TaxID=491253 RepID=A0ABR0SQJ9_9HYPO